MALQIEIRSTTERQGMEDREHRDVGTSELQGCFLQALLISSPGIHAHIADIGCQRAAPQAGGPWGHSHHSQCYRRRADRQGCAVEVTRIFFVLPEAGLSGKSVSTAKDAKGTKEKQGQHSESIQHSDNPPSSQQLQEGPEKIDQVEAKATVSRNGCVAEC